MGDVLCNHILDVMEGRSEHTTQPVSFKNKNITWSRKVVKEMKENQPDTVLVDRKKSRSCL